VKYELETKLKRPWPILKYCPQDMPGKTEETHEKPQLG